MQQTVTLTPYYRPKKPVNGQESPKHHVQKRCTNALLRAMKSMATQPVVRSPLVHDTIIYGNPTFPASDGTMNHIFGSPCLGHFTTHPEIYLTGVLAAGQASPGEGENWGTISAIITADKNIYTHTCNLLRIEIKVIPRRQRWSRSRIEE